MNTEDHEKLSAMSRHMTWHMGIGDVAAATGVSQSQLRYWEQKGYIESKKVPGQNRKYTYGTLMRVFIINSFINEGFTLVAAVKKADENKETMDIIKRAVIDRFQGIEQIDGYPAVNLGYVNEHHTEVLYAVVKEDHTDLKMVPVEAWHVYNVRHYYSS